MAFTSDYFELSTGTGTVSNAAKDAEIEYGYPSHRQVHEITIEAGVSATFGITIYPPPDYGWCLVKPNVQGTGSYSSVGYLTRDSANEADGPADGTEQTGKTAITNSSGNGEFWLYEQCPRIVMSGATHNTESYIQVMFSRTRPAGR